MNSKYPYQREIIWLDFDPSLGFEINKRRPALVISSDKYNLATHMCVVLPITSTHKGINIFTPFSAKKISGCVNTLQIRTVDYQRRKFEHIEFMSQPDFFLAIERHKVNVY
ncbi:hypothetical protein LOOC260_101830 [Paucilactobacillus hokkaidonensis JCM 18461]|uniref:Type II toxin-antitoxin system PemK/MazF family toxin n=2 Tax=Paucilactobacillus hokkaidonensis TaxID=1193095 RepID=A0A0A1GWK6_9LACO|nr:type II toxin-antitoxin system PemK/MazF family toxin [Paucilactobacillus hokkaidonensis]KRO09873.1 hypothetical protein IV59_GL000341 [Paucilactobacillus hokkaidonensis]BAP84761.1 hypothetical protein LOOC260_101830 [Paucilactobacillus hokkaidonensis JCM 18461]